MRGVDAARALAIVGMVMVHVGPDTDGDRLAEVAYGSTHGRASILFGVIAGVGISLLAGERTPVRLRRLDRRLAVRAAVLFPLGLLLQALPHGVAVILHFYAVYFLVGALAARLPDSWLLCVAGAFLAVGPLVIVAAEQRWPQWFEAGTATIADLALDGVVLREILLTGTYPVVTWAAPVLFGVWLGRRDLRSPAVRWRMAWGGLAAVAVAYATEALAVRSLDGSGDLGWSQLAVTEAHGQTAPWLLQATGVAVVVLAVSLVACDRLPTLALPAAVVGQMALSVYVGHLLVLTGWPGLLVRDTVGGATIAVAAFTVGTALLALAWWRLVPRGPLELLLDLPAGTRHRG